MKIVAMVSFNSDWAYVFDEPVHLKYREETIDGCRYLIGQHGPFFDFLGYEKASGRFKAFGGRELTLTMEDGSTRTVKDDWWSCGSPFGDLTKITYSDVPNLKRCYVFGGGYAGSEELQSMIDEYENRTSGPYNHRNGGWRYDYYDFEKVIKYDDARRAALERQRRIERANQHLVRNVKMWARFAREKPRVRVPAICVRAA